jgi:hypothetical protein
MAASAQRRAAAARVRRNGGTQQAAADAAKISLRQFKRWEREDAFANLIHGRGVLVAGPLAITADHDAAIETDEEMSVLWVALGRRRADTNEFIPPEVLGSLVVSDATLLRVVFVLPPEVQSVAADLQAHAFPLLPDARRASNLRPACRCVRGDRGKRRAGFW